MFKRDTIIVLVQLLLIVILALWASTTGIAPINNNIIEASEGFHPIGSSLEYTDVSEPTLAKDDTHALRSINPDMSECKKVNGFPGYGVFCTPASGPKAIDIYSQAKGDINCNGLGYFNSKGPLCMTDEMKLQLATRGSNAKGGNGQIGSA
jgi:hypothetical protein